MKGIFAIVFALALVPAEANELVRLKVRGDAEQAYALYDGGVAAPAYAAVLFTGGDGIVDFRDRPNGRFVAMHKGNFLVRSAELFAGEGFVAAVVDRPSDQPGGMSDFFRSGSDHAADIAAVIDDLRKRYPGIKSILIGTSRGTLSAAYVARALGDKVDGVVLTSSVFRPTRQSMGLGGFGFRDIRAPILFVHHEEDGCSTCCAYSEARWISGYPLVTVKGGDVGHGNPCEAQSHHGYLGQETQVVAAIKAWIAGKPYPKVIE